MNSYVPKSRIPSASSTNICLPTQLYNQLTFLQRFRTFMSQLLAMVSTRQHRHLGNFGQYFTERKALAKPTSTENRLIFLRCAQQYTRRRNPAFCCEMWPSNNIVCKVTKTNYYCVVLVIISPKICQSLCEPETLVVSTLCLSTSTLFCVFFNTCTIFLMISYRTHERPGYYAQRMRCVHRTHFHVLHPLMSYIVARDLILFSPVFLLPLLPYYRKEQLPLSADE